MYLQAFSKPNLINSNINQQKVSCMCNILSNSSLKRNKQPVLEHKHAPLRAERHNNTYLAHQNWHPISEFIATIAVTSIIIIKQSNNDSQIFVMHQNHKVIVNVNTNSKSNVTRRNLMTNSTKLYLILSSFQAYMEKNFLFFIFQKKMMTMFLIRCKQFEFEFPP